MRVNSLSKSDVILDFTESFQETMEYQF